MSPNDYDHREMHRRMAEADRKQRAKVAYAVLMTLASFAVIVALFLALFLALSWLIYGR